MLPPLLLLFPFFLFSSLFLFEHSIHQPLKAEVSAFVRNQPKKYQEDLDFDATPERPLKQIGKHTQVKE